MHDSYSRTLCEAALATAMVVSIDFEPTPAYSLANLPLGHPPSTAQLINYRHCENRNRFVICSWVLTPSSEAAHTQRRRNALDTRYKPSVRWNRANEQKEWH
jgi:hypothetical protein